MTASREAVHHDPVWRERADFIIAVRIEPGDTGIDTEQIWASRLAKRRFEVCCIPFFVYDLSLGDVVETDDAYLIENVVTWSGHHTFRVALSQARFPSEELVTELQNLGDLVEWSSPIMFAVDSPDSVIAQRTADLLAVRENRGELVYETGRRSPA